MAIDIEFAYKFIKDICLNYIGKTFKSTLWTALLIVIVTLTIVVLLYPAGEKISAGGYIKPILYTFLSTLVILFIHDSCLQDESNLNKENNSAENIIGGIKMFRNKNSTSGGVYEAVYGKDEENVTARSHQSVGGNSYVSSTDNNQTNEDKKDVPVEVPNTSNMNDGEIVNISQEI